MLGCPAQLAAHQLGVVDKLLFGSIFVLTDHLRGGTPEEESERVLAYVGQTILSTQRDSRTDTD